jgi:hypothetical protein
VNKGLLAAVAATIVLAGCISPYEDTLKASLAACRAGNGAACTEASNLSIADQQWHTQKNAEVGNAILGVLAVGVAAASIAAAAHPPPPPPAPIIFVPRW